MKLSELVYEQEKKDALDLRKRLEETSETGVPVKITKEEAVTLQVRL